MNWDLDKLKVSRDIITKGLLWVKPLNSTNVAWVLAKLWKISLVIKKKKKEEEEAGTQDFAEEETC